MIHKSPVIFAAVGLIVGVAATASIYSAQYSGENITSQTAPVANGYKKLTGMPLNFEVPETWSIYQQAESYGSDTLPVAPNYSVGMNNVAFGDINWTQVDFFVAQGDIVDTLVEKAEKEIDELEKASNYPEYATWSTEKIDDVTAKVVTYGLDEGGQVTKGGTGGKHYYIKLPGTGEYDPKTLVIHKQSLGDDVFEAGFKHMVKTMSFAR